VVFSTGGYIAAPAILAGRWCWLWPVVLHDPICDPGRGTRLAGGWCSRGWRWAFRLHRAPCPAVARCLDRHAVRQDFSCCLAPLTGRGVPAGEGAAASGGKFWAAARGARAETGWGPLVPQLLVLAAGSCILTGSAFGRLGKRITPAAMWSVLPADELGRGLLRHRSGHSARSGAGQPSELAVLRHPPSLGGRFPRRPIGTRDRQCRPLPSPLAGP